MPEKIPNSTDVFSTWKAMCHIARLNKHSLILMPPITRHGAYFHRHCVHPYIVWTADPFTSELSFIVHHHRSKQRRMPRKMFRSSTDVPDNIVQTSPDPI